MLSHGNFVYPIEIILYDLYGLPKTYMAYPRPTPPPALDPLFLLIEFISSSITIIFKMLVIKTCIPIIYTICESYISLQAQFKGLVAPRHVSLFTEHEIFILWFVYPFFLIFDSD